MLFKYYSHQSQVWKRKVKLASGFFFAYEQLNNKGERMGKAGKAMSLLKLFITSDDQK